MLRAARRSPDEAFLGLDADVARMREASHRAARAAAKGGLPNAWFAVAAAEALPTELDGRVDELRVTLPWGSLLRGALGPEPWFHEAVRRLLRRDGGVEMLLSVVSRDALPGTAALDHATFMTFAARYRDAGWLVLDAREATPADVACSGSSWARRLGIPARRSAWVLRACPGGQPVRRARSS